MVKNLEVHYDLRFNNKNIPRALYEGLHEAREMFSIGKLNAAIEIYDTLGRKYEELETEIFAELYDQYQTISIRDRYHLYQSRFFDFNIQKSDKVLDIGSGNVPFYLATDLADITLDDDELGRVGVPFRLIKGKKVHKCDIENLPFKDKEFDFVYCSHVLEHVVCPEKACSELIRVGKRGYIEAPNKAKDLWLNTANVSNHFWSLQCADNKLIFCKYTAREREGLNSNLVMKMHVCPQTDREKAFSALIYLRADQFNIMFLWENSFEYEVEHFRQSNHNALNVSSDMPHFSKNESLNYESSEGAIELIKSSYDTVWKSKLNDSQWVANDGKGRVAYCAAYLKKFDIVKSGAKILDLGCGRGVLKSYLEDIEVDLHGIDVSSVAVKEAKKVYCNAHLVNLDSDNLPYENDFFDIITALDVIEHVFDPNVMLREAYRVLKPGGFFVLSTPNILFDKYIKSLIRSRRFPKTSLDEYPYDGGHIHFFTYGDINALLKKAGFSYRPMGPESDKFDYEFKEPLVWTLSRK